MIRPLLWLPLAALSLGPALAEEASLQERAEALHKLAGGEWCAFEGGFVPDDRYSSWTFTYQPTWSEEADPQEVTLIRIFCGAGAYNISHAYYLYTEFDGLTPVGFAAPVVDPQYKDGDSEGELECLPVIGFEADMLLVNSEFDLDTQTVTSYSKWRGIGDASSSGTWVFRDGTFVLVSYDVDASYDGEINPETVVDYTAR